MRRYLLIFSLCLLVLFIFCGISLFPKNSTPRPTSLAEPPEVLAPQASDIPHDTTPDAFYQFIIDNNLFRPLGWRTPKKQPDYTLIGTAVSENIEDSNAFILERSSGRMHIVKVGDVFGEALVKVIESKRVILNEGGKEIVLYCGRLQFIRTN